MSKGPRRYLRTLVLGVAALGLLLWTAVDQFGVSREELLDMLIATCIVVGLVITAAAVVVLTWAGLRRLFGRRSR